MRGSMWLSCPMSIGVTETICIANWMFHVHGGWCSVLWTSGLLRRMEGLPCRGGVGIHTSYTEKSGS